MLMSCQGVPDEVILKKLEKFLKFLNNYNVVKNWERKAKHVLEQTDK